MTVFATDLITRFSNDAEAEFAAEFPCIVDRLALDIVSGTSEYTLPDYVISIRKITWMGKKVDTTSHRRYRDYFSPSSTGTPYLYIYNNLGQGKIKFLPAPNVTIAAVTINLFGSEIANRVIVEYYRTPDFVSFTIPIFFRRRLLKAYVLKKCFAVEGKGQNYKGVKYWNARWEYLKETYGTLLSELIDSPRMILVGKSVTYRQLIPTPVLPYNDIGIGVRKGE